MQKTKCRPCCEGLPYEEKACGKREQSLDGAVTSNETIRTNGVQKAAVQQGSRHVGQLSTKATVDEKQKKKLVDSGELVSEDTEPVKETNESDPANEEILADCILLCIEGLLNGFLVKFLINSGVTDCFVSTAFIKEKELDLNKRK